MSVVVPTVMAETIEQFQATMESAQTFARRVHIDLSDGDFAPTFLLPIDQMSWPEAMEVDIHAMIARPSEQLAQIVQKRPSLVILHAEAQEDILPHLQYLKQQGIRAGVALLKTTVPSTVEPLLKEADHIMIFSGDLGKFGGTASMMQLEKVRLIKNINPKAEIGWDGGASIENAYTLSQGGIDVVNAGGAINNAAVPADAYASMVKEINKHGVI